MNAGKLLRAVRRARLLNQRDLAALAGVRRSTIDRIESGQTSTPSLALMERILRASGYAFAVIDEYGRLLRLDDGRLGLWDRGGRRFPAHCKIWETKYDPYWWGWYRIAWSPEDLTMPTWTYSPKPKLRYYEGWAGAYFQEMVT